MLTTTYDKCPFSEKKCPVSDTKINTKECALAAELSIEGKIIRRCYIREIALQLVSIADSLSKQQ